MSPPPAAAHFRYRPITANDIISLRFSELFIITYLFPLYVISLIYFNLILLCDASASRSRIIYICRAVYCFTRRFMALRHRRCEAFFLSDGRAPGAYLKLLVALR